MCMTKIQPSHLLASLSWASASICASKGLPSLTPHGLSGLRQTGQWQGSWAGLCGLMDFAFGTCCLAVSQKL